MLTLLEEVLSAMLAARGSMVGTLDVEALRTRLVPVPGVEIHVPNGGVLTGVIVISDNRPIVMLVSRHEPPPRRCPRPEPWSPVPPSDPLWAGEYPDQ